ncbi:MAG: bifunctional glutamate N-acetyltransferase/amino-acid acetyltransferase ArgJ [Gammaproteobacteria bacterium]|nr:bifunctional glutamate N-acetyltransferase/amino-acid acetyltransferase ArgJ [Gammaproteobacteria bacterium]
MAVGPGTFPEMLPVAGVRLGTTRAGLRRSGERDDLLLIELVEDSAAAAVFTRNAFCAAPVVVAREHLAHRAPRWLLVNAGNANAGTGAEGLASARTCCAAVADDPARVLPFSTGVIGEPLPVDKVVAALPSVRASLSESGWMAAARAIMTTDTRPKGASRRVMIDGRPVTVTGIAKGAGMIRPDMATMLAFIATDAEAPADLLRSCLDGAVAASFNRISVDGDTSTNDACVLMATGASGVRLGDRVARELFADAVMGVCVELAQAIVRDGEGATKFITVEVEGGADAAECLRVAETIAHSPLVKTAFYASDPNWGRILAAVGRAGVEALDLERVVIDLDEVRIVESGGRAPGYREADGQRVMDREEITVRVDLGRGAAREWLWTCDFSHDYVTINAEYRT